jgi:hypothetical protein
MNRHHVWRPRVDHDHLLNPFSPITQRDTSLDHVALDAEEEEEQDEALLDPTEEQSGNRPRQEK